MPKDKPTAKEIHKEAEDLRDGLHYSIQDVITYDAILPILRKMSRLLENMAERIEVLEERLDQPQNLWPPQPARFFDPIGPAPASTFVDPLRNKPVKPKRMSKARADKARARMVEYWEKKKTEAKSPRKGKK